MNKLKEFLNTPILYFEKFIKLLFISSLVGCLGGFVGACFHLVLDYVTEFRTHHSIIIYFLPVSGMVIAGLYHFFYKKGKLNTNRIIKAASGDGDVPAVIVPLIFISTAITHFFGGSAGREGAALQIGGGIGYKLSRIFKFNKDASSILILSGMSGVFSALFGTPLAAAVFPIEIVRSKMEDFTAFFPCIIASLIGRYISYLFGISPIAFNLTINHTMSPLLVLKITILALLCVLLGFVFCSSVRYCGKTMKKHIPNSYLRAFFGGLVVVVLTLLVRTYDYNGAGMDVITNAVSGNARPEAFLLKIIFTAITLAAGFCGGEIVPTLFIGSTFGCVVAPILGIDAGFGAALGMVSMFCSVTKTPLSSIFIAVEMFGVQGILFYAIVCSVTFMMSGYKGLYITLKEK